MAATGNGRGRRPPGPGDRPLPASAGGSTWTWPRCPTSPPSAGAFIWQPGPRVLVQRRHDRHVRHRVRARPPVAPAWPPPPSTSRASARRRSTPTTSSRSCTRRAAQRAAALKPYERMIPRGLDAVMVAIAGFPAYDPTGAAGRAVAADHPGPAARQAALRRRHASPTRSAPRPATTSAPPACWRPPPAPTSCSTPTRPRASWRAEARRCAPGSSASPTPTPPTGESSRSSASSGLPELATGWRTIRPREARPPARACRRPRARRAGSPGANATSQASHEARSAPRPCPDDRSPTCSLPRRRTFPPRARPPRERAAAARPGAWWPLSAGPLLPRADRVVALVDRRRCRC